MVPMAFDPLRPCYGTRSALRNRNSMSEQVNGLKAVGEGVSGAQPTRRKVVIVALKGIVNVAV